MTSFYERKLRNSLRLDELLKNDKSHNINHISIQTLANLIK